MKTQWTEKKVSLGGAIIAIAVAVFAGILIGTNWQTWTTDFGVYLGTKKPAQSMDFSELDSVFKVLSTNFDGDLDKTKLLEGAKRGLIDAAGDKYTTFMTASDYSLFNQSLSGDVGAGIGIELGVRDGYVKVLRTLPDNPARSAGILAGDIIYKVNGEEVYDLTAEEVANKVRGVAGSEVEVTVARDGEELPFKMSREKINNTSAYVEYDGTIANIIISRFDGDTATIMTSIAKEIVSKNIDKIIVDLRGNGGGYVEAVCNVLSLWVDGSLVMDQRSSGGYNDEKYFAKTNQAILKGKDTVVLINGSTASAAEIMAGALRDYKLATIIGEKSYGKGSVQIITNLIGGDKLKVTIAKWYTPNGQNINHEGISPDITIERTFDDVNTNRDPQLEKAKSVLNS